ncbi:suppressor for copper-sensitivity B [uncultured Gammaproteobacteria bacterium]
MVCKKNWGKRNWKLSWLMSQPGGRWRALALAGLILGAVVATTARAAELGGWQSSGALSGRLVAAVSAVGDLNPVPLGLHLRLQPGWKAYWRSPGDAGLPPTLDWSGSANFLEAKIAWPAPHRFTVFGIETFGYDSEVVLPLALAPAAPGQPLVLTAKADVLVCSDICVPETIRLALSVPAGLPQPSPEANLLARFAARVPGDGTAHGLTISAARLVGPAAAPELELEADAREPFQLPDLFVESEPPLAFGPPRLTLSPGGRHLRARLSSAEPAALAKLAGSILTITLVDEPRAAEVRLPLSVGGGSGWDRSKTETETGLMAMLAFALVGGLLLNLMPCVLPVLSLKLLSVLGLGGAGERQARLGFLASAAGIMASFLLLAGVLAGLRTAGAAVGWGIQFQQPWFLVFLIVVITLFACNLWGWFEIILPGVLADTAVAHGGGPTLAGHFLTGAFATLMATPCSAPFLGTAVGFALARGTGEIMAIFIALGLGMALPYLLVAAAPRLATRLPRPGRWMITLRRVLGGVLALTGLWLVGVLATSSSSTAALVVAALMAAGVALLALRRTWTDRPQRAALVGVGLLLAMAFVAPPLFGGIGERREPAETEPGWVAFAPEAIAGHVAAGRTVLVEITADWCVTCQVNKRLVLERGEVVRRVRAGVEAGKLVAMRADWTRPDQTIAAYLASFARYGVPFTAVYGPGLPQGLVLPELLSEGAVLTALSKASLRD